MNEKIKAQLEEGITLKDLMQELKIDNYFDFSNWVDEVIDNDEMQAIYPNMGDMDEGTYEGQPIVWDGGFGVSGDYLVYNGWEGASGSGKIVKRIVFDASIIQGFL